MRSRGLQYDRRVQIAIGVALVALVGLVFFWIGWASRPAPEYKRERELADRLLRLSRDSRFFSAESIWEAASAERISNHLRFITEKPHISGVNMQRVNEYFLNHFNKLEGFSVFTKEYQVTLGLPTADSYFKIFYSNDTEMYTSQTQEKQLWNVSLDGQVRPILSFTPSDNVSSTRVVYANYGREKDFEKLKAKSVNLTGAIAVMRYGQAGRGKKLVNAAAFGCIGGIVYSDPADNWADPSNLTDSNVYPNAWWLPPTGVQRGSAKMVQSDPQTPDYPSHEQAYRISVQELQDQEDPRILSPIPGYPVGYGDARVLLEALGGEEADADFKGGLPIKYRIGGEFKEGIDNLRLVVNNEIKEKVEAKNIFALMKGEIEPDRYILVGNHRDAWGTGVVDASSGSSVLLELATVLSSYYSKGWRPRRSILLCSWDVEEQGITGSWEWVEDKFMQIKDRASAYLNIDIAARGNYVIRPNADPLMQELVLQSLKNVPLEQEEDGVKTLYELYKKRWLDAGNKMTVPISGSDYSAFIQKAGTPVIDVSYIADPKVSTYYPIYHSIYETFYAMDNLIDPGMLSHRKVAVWATELLRMLSDTWLIKYDSANLAKSLQDMQKSSNPPAKWNWPKELTELQQFAEKTWSAMESELAELQKKAGNWTKELDAIQEKIDSGDADPMRVRAVNDAGMRLMQALTDYHGQTRDPTKHNYFYSSRSEETNNEIDVKFPGLADLLAVAHNQRQAGNKEQVWKLINQHLAAIKYRITSLCYQMEENL